MTANSDILPLACPQCGGQKFAEIQDPARGDGLEVAQMSGGVVIAGPEARKFRCLYCDFEFLFTPPPPNVQGAITGGDAVTVYVGGTARPAPDLDNRAAQFNFLLNTLTDRLGEPGLTLSDDVRQSLTTAIVALREQMASDLPERTMVQALLTQMGDRLSQEKKWKLAGIVTALEDHADTLFASGR
jgi:hypothetical protein